jgi:diphosphomevalonate decarboxylase
MFSANDFIPTQYSHSIERGNQWSAPSNIALNIGEKGKPDSSELRLFYPKELQTITKLVFAKKGKAKYFFF